MILVQTHNGIATVASVEHAWRLLMKYPHSKLVLDRNHTGKNIYVSARPSGEWWYRAGHASDTAPTLRTQHGRPAILSVPKNRTMYMQGVKPESPASVGMKLKVLEFKASGFDSICFSANATHSALLYELSIGNTCLVLPAELSLDFTGVYVYNRVDHFEIRAGNSSELAPHICRNTNTLWVPKYFINQKEEIPMDLLSVLMAEELFAVTVTFPNNSTEYTYKSTVEYAPGTKVVVDTPSNGLVVVTVKHCAKGLDTLTDKFAAYKWVVDSIDLEEYNRLRDLEVSLVQKAKARKRLEEAKKQLEELGLTEAEIMAMVKSNG